VQLVTTIRGLVREQGGRIPSCETGNFFSKVRAQKLAPDIVRLIEPLLVLIEGINRQLCAKYVQCLYVLCLGYVRCLGRAGRGVARGPAGGLAPSSVQPATWP
jgi:hypothetical protein